MPKKNFLPEGTKISSHARNGSGTHLEQSFHNTKVTNESIEKAANSGTLGKPAPPSKPTAPAPRNRFNRASSDQLSASSLENFLSERGCSKIPNRYDLRTLWSADGDPPITKEKLSELDVEKLYHNHHLRHDQNFGRDIHFSPRSPYDALGRQNQLEAQTYWDAVEIELALHISHLEGLRLKLRPGSLLDEHCSLPAPSSLSHVPLRLSRMIWQMRRIIATLVPLSMESLIKTRLDYKMCMQELEHGQLDIAALFAWVGALLLESCAPSRDAKIGAMVKTMSLGYENHDPHLLRRGLQDLFSVLEIMKLDATNYQFQLQRNYMLMRSIEAERLYVVFCLKNGWKVPNWLQDSAASPPPRFIFFVTRLISLISQPTGYALPTALALDHSRIHHLRLTFQHLAFRAACIYTFASTLNHLGHKSPLQASSNSTITDLITSFEQETPLLTPYADRDRHESLILAIAHLASSNSTQSHLPTPSTLAFTREIFHANIASNSQFQSPVKSGGRAIADTLTAKLTRVVEAELKEVESLKLSALGLANRYISPKSLNKPLDGTAGPGTVGLNDDAEKFEARGLEEMARRVVHIAVLHWRVWGPLLYEKRSEVGGDDGGIGT